MVDVDKRKFLKHMGYVGAVGVLGLGVAQFASNKGDALVDSLQESEQEQGFRKVWATKRDEENNYGLPYAQYYEDAVRLHIWACSVCDYIYDVTAGREARFDELPSSWTCPACAEATKDDFQDIGIAARSGGQPMINVAVCAFHYDEDGDGKYEASEEGVFCTMPCKNICPPEAIKKGAIIGPVGEDRPKLGPVVDFVKCIRCVRCHKICGYNSIEWVNQPYRDLGGSGGGL